jgi:predicted dehydrogenase
MSATRRDFIKTMAAGAAGVTIGGIGLSKPAYKRIMGSNDRIRVGVIGFSDRGADTLFPAFLSHASSMNFEIIAVSDIWNRRRNDAEKYFSDKGVKISLSRNNDELYSRKDIDAVIISTPDFQHARHAIEAVNAGCDLYVEKPFAETMEDNRAALKAVTESGKIFQIGSQRRSGANYIAASEYIKSGKFGDIVMVEMCWNVNQPDRWRRPQLVESIREKDTDWKRFLNNRPVEPWNPRHYLEYRLFWPYSSGIPGQWMSHQVDTVHWFTGYSHPRSVAAGGGIYLWKDGRKNVDTLTAVFDYGPLDNMEKGFQVVYSSRFTNSAGGVKELYFSNGGSLNLETNTISSEGGLESEFAKPMGMQANLLASFKLPQVTALTGSNLGSDPMTFAHMKNWMECVRNRKEGNGNIHAAYNHSIANIMTTAALHTGEKTVFNEQTQEVLAGGKVFKF